MNVSVSLRRFQYDEVYGEADVVCLSLNDFYHLDGIAEIAALKYLV
jgi:hypothetical protein